MKKLSKLQEEMLENWINTAEQSSLKISDIVNLGERLTTLIGSFEKPISYFPRLIDELV